MNNPGKTKWRFAAIMGLLLVSALALSGRFLVVNRPQRADVIVVLAGETEVRPACGLHLLEQGYAPRVQLDVPADARIFLTYETELAEQYVQGLPQAQSIKVCPIYGLSTKGEVQDVRRCLRDTNAHTVLLETSEYHSRRALSIFRDQDKGREYSVSACDEPVRFGVMWWQHREWAKTNFNEWMRFFWWEVIDRWV